MLVFGGDLENHRFITEILRKVQYVLHLILSETVVLHYSLHLRPSPLLYNDLQVF